MSENESGFNDTIATNDRIAVDRLRLRNLWFVANRNVIRKQALTERMPRPEEEPMHIVTKTSVLLISILGLAACETPSEPFAFDTTFSSFADMETAFQASTDALVDEDGALVDTDDISQSADFAAADLGSTIYNGAIIASEEDDGGTLIGQLQLEVAFDTNTMDGRAGNFFHSEDGAVTGTLLGNTTFVRDVDVDADQNHFTMALTGALSENGRGYAATIDLEGNFLNGTNEIESIAGDATVNLGEGAATYEEGAFAATR